MTLKKPKFLDNFLKKAQSIHNNKYDYSSVEYKNAHTKVKIICPEHGAFMQRPHAHTLIGQGCPACAIEKNKFSTEVFIKKSRKIHGYKYNYSSVNYKDSKAKVKIICPDHGKFLQIAENHMSKGHGCPRCYGFNKTTINFIEEARPLHHNKYNYSKSTYFNNNTPVTIICKIHGEFKQTPYVHNIKKAGCPKCAHHGFNPDKEATLYYIKDKDTGLYKIGITNNSLYDRFGKAFLESRAEILMEQSYENGQDAYLAEQEILQAFKPYRCNNDTWPEAKGGKTEFFNRNILEL